MSNEALSTTDDTAQNTVLKSAIDGPAKLVDLSLNSDDNIRASGLILTADQIVSLRRYEVTARRLPITIETVIPYLNYNAGQGAGPGLEPEDFLQSFCLIHAHASRWNGLRDNIVLTGTKLNVFAGRILIYRNTMNEIYDDIKEMKKLEEYNIRTMEDVEKLEREYGEKFIDIGLDDEDKFAVRGLAENANEIYKLVRIEKDNAENLKKELDSFSDDLAKKVIREVELKIQFIANTSLPDDVLQLMEVIKLREAEITEMNAAYSEAVKKAITSALTGGGLITAIFTGVEAEKIRKRRKEAVNAQDRDIATLETKQKVLGSLRRVNLDMQNLATVVLDADIATHNLRIVWNAIHAYAVESTNAVKEADNTLAVWAFMRDFRLVVQPWENIKDESAQLLDVFKDAAKKYDETYGAKP